jgi:hypothetical protein
MIVPRNIDIIKCSGFDYNTFRESLDRDGKYIIDIDFVQGFKPGQSDYYIIKYCDGFWTEDELIINGIN